MSTITQTQPPAAGEAAHTPGPWLLPTKNKGCLPVYVAAKDERYKTGMVLICSVGDLANGPHDYREVAANARLIAAAPELLGALWDALPILEHLDSVREEDEAPCNVVLKARAALAKAKGAP